jgi:anti-anti-sigma factor
LGSELKISVEQVLIFGIVNPCGLSLYKVLMISSRLTEIKKSLSQENGMSEIINQEDQTIVKPGKDIVASMAEGFRNELLSVINDSSSELVIDLAGVEMVDSVGIGVIIAAHNTLNQSGRKLKVINVTKDVYGLFTTMRLNRRFTVEGV